MKIKTSQAIDATPLLSGAKLTRMAAADKIALIKAAMELKAVADAAAAYLRDMGDRLKQDDTFDEKYKLLQQWQREGDATTLTEKERSGLNAYFNAFNEAYEAGAKEKREEAYETKYAALPADAFMAFAESNDFTVEQFMLLSGILTEERPGGKE